MKNHWVCDHCKLPIYEPEHGWVEWTKKTVDQSEYLVTQMRLVHHVSASPLAPEGTCQFNEAVEIKRHNGTVSDRPLKDYLGPDGLMNLLEHLADPAFRLIDIPAMIKRIQVPGYDQVKGYVDRAIKEGVIELNQPKGFYTQDQIKGVIEHYEN